MHGVRTAVEVVTPPPYEPVSLTEAKAWMRVDTDDEDAVVRLVVQAMTKKAENITGRAFVQRTLRLHQSNWSYGRGGLRINLPYPPLVSVSSFEYYDSDGVLQTLAADQYVVHNEAEPGFIVPEWDVSWPTIRLVPFPLRITYDAGYEAGSPTEEAAYQEAIPANLKLWMESNALTLFDNRAQFITGTIIAQLPRTFGDGLLDDLVIGERLF